MIKIKAGNASNSTAIGKFHNAEIDHFGLKLIVHVLIGGSLGNCREITPQIRITTANFYDYINLMLTYQTVGLYTRAPWNQLQK